MTPVALSTIGTMIRTMFNFSFLPKYLPYFTQGVAYTLLLALGAVLIAIIPALGLALQNTHAWPVKGCRVTDLTLKNLPPLPGCVQ